MSRRKITIGQAGSWVIACALFFALLLLVISNPALSIALHYPFQQAATHYGQQKVPYVPKDELEKALLGASMANNTLMITTVNKAYADKGSMLDLFLESLRQGEDTQHLTQHLLVVALDISAFNRCREIGLHCYKLVTDDVDFSGEKLYMTQDYLDMMWRRTLFLGQVLKRNYSFVFTDTDVMWLRNPFHQFSQEDDIQISCDRFNGKPHDLSNLLNTGFYHVRSNNRTVKLYDLWYESKSSANFTGLKDQDVLEHLKFTEIFRELGLKIRVLDTLYFSGFCEKSRDLRIVNTMHANCCKSLKAKLLDLRTVLMDWKRHRISVTDGSNWNSSFNGWSESIMCIKSWFEKR
ncbi:uncharacterized protein At1g28695 isoform X2 [Amborella trichopoda]|uniref:Nucleotide-diphospho-sugar transferase domain-containing protein n=1 Tax=Amborella trichopoda TaxID=13333 RepID=W1NZH7_AMBTC|nr:uncharacterized protein At1g28695 isoform X2 [Amborella trichopoda]ERN01078.1 hypothetical protein AMTR_s00002p00179370 [Amborella trichopoda]|eukprot:XP_020519853.1 uncharacterized protein At1g28695 isoform X2 [Amborella trichopoda]